MKQITLVTFAVAFFALAAWNTPATAQTESAKPSTTAPTATASEPVTPPFAIVRSELPVQPPFGTGFTATCKEGFQFLVIFLKELKKDGVIEANEADQTLIDDTGKTISPIAFGFPPLAKPDALLISGFTFTGGIKNVESDQTLFGLVFLVPKDSKTFKLSSNSTDAKPLKVLKDFDPPKSYRLNGYANNGKVEFATPTIKQNGWGMNIK